MGGVALAVDARELALHSSIRRLLNERCDGFLIDSIGPACRHDPLLSRAVLVEDASRDGDFVSLRVEIVAVQLGAVWHAVEGGVTISVNGTAEEERVAEWRAGRTLEAPVTYRRPARYLNDGVPDFERDLALAGTTLLGTVKSGLLIDVVREGGYWAEVSADIRSHVRHAVARWIEPHDPISAAIASAVLIGDRTGLPDETREALQAAGTYHVIAISGGNIAILAAAATLLLSVVAVRGRSAAIVAIAVLSGYALVITAGPSVWRATWMAILYFAARAVDHRSGAWQSSSVAAALMIVARPLDVRDAGFILTFGATLALLEGARMRCATQAPDRRTVVGGSIRRRFACHRDRVAAGVRHILLSSDRRGAGAQSARCSLNGCRADRGAGGHACGSSPGHRRSRRVDLAYRCTGTGWQRESRDTCALVDRARAVTSSRCRRGVLPGSSGDDLLEVSLASRYRRSRTGGDDTGHHRRSLRCPLAPSPQSRSCD